MTSAKDFKKYIDGARGETPHIAFFLAEVRDRSNAAEAVKVCKNTIGKLYERRGGDKGTANSRCTYASYYRKSFLKMANDLGIDEAIVSACRPILKASDEDTAASKSKQQQRTRKQQANLTPFNPQAVLDQIEVGLASDDWRELAAALVMCCHARPADLLKLGEFKVLSKYQVEFTSRAKKRGGAAVGNIWVMIPAAQFMDAFSRLRRMPEVIRYQKMSNSDVDSSANSSIGTGVKNLFGKVLPIPYAAKGESSASNARAAATNLAQWLYGKDEIHVAELATRQLMHDSTSAEASYRDYRLVDEEGKAIKEYGVRMGDVDTVIPYYFYQLAADGLYKPESMIPDNNPAIIELSKAGKVLVHVDPQVETMPKSKTKSSMTIDRQLLAEMDSFGGGSRSEQLVSIMALARQAEELKKQLDYQKKQNAKLRKELEDMPKATATETAADKPQVETAKTADTAQTEIDIRKLPDSELKGKKKGYAEERIRRTVAAIQDYNAGRNLSEQIAVNKGSLRALSGANVQTINKWADEHAEELRQYTEGQGHGFRQNVGKDLSVIRLPWNE